MNINDVNVQGRLEKADFVGYEFYVLDFKLVGFCDRFDVI